MTGLRNRSLEELSWQAHGDRGRRLEFPLVPIGNKRRCCRLLRDGIMGPSLVSYGKRLHLYITLLPTTLTTSTSHTLNMKFFSVITGALLASSAAALSIGTTKNVQNALADDLSVPGENPLNYCAKPEDDILEIETVDLSPNPPTA